MRPGPERDSFSLYTRMARRPDTGQACSHIPQPMHRAGSTKGRSNRTTISTRPPAAVKTVCGQGALQDQTYSGQAGNTPERRLGLSGGRR